MLRIIRDPILLNGFDKLAKSNLVRVVAQIFIYVSHVWSQYILTRAQLECWIYI